MFAIAGARLGLGNAKASGREPKSCLGQVFSHNCRFTAWRRRMTTWLNSAQVSSW